MTRRPFWFVVERCRPSDALWPAVALLGASLLWYGPWLLAPYPRMGGDVLTEFYPWLTYAVA